MKLKLLLLSLFLVVCTQEAMAAQDAGLSYISSRGKILCGTDLFAKTYAFKDDETGEWKGIDVDICKTFSMAIFGRNDRFEMVNVSSDEVQKALNSQKIDIMLSGALYSASAEAEKKYAVAGLMYYDKQLFLGKSMPGVKSLEGYKGKRVCAVSNSDDFDNVQDYSNKYDLDLKPLMFVNATRAKGAFFLNRCDLLTGNEIYLKGILKNSFTEDSNLMIIPETITVRPIFAFVANDNPTLATTAKWIFNALSLAEEKDIDSKNIATFIGQENATIKNLLGIEPKLWKKFNLEPEWLKNNVTELGNFGEIYERNIGKDSELEIERKENKLIRDGGLISTLPFL